ncbi:response regulator [Cohnella boryungensis]|uniref:Response regulator n=1 Tax=Cohnella boryungensis TaxID=768479 RepID=A0ABV8S4A2_9BACL
MHHLLIVDDEILAAQGIKNGINWGSMGFSSVSVAHNVTQAKEIIGKHRVDVMICDIEMPRGNGIELLQWVKEHNPSVEAVFLTCHANFQYAQQAVQLGSLDYLLKPVRFDELEASIRKAVQKIEAELLKLQQSESMQKYQALWSKHQPVFVERFWSELLQRQLPPDQTRIEEIIERKNLPIKAAMLFIPVLISVQEWSKPYSVRELKLMEYAIRNAAIYAMELEQMQGQVLSSFNGKWVVLVPQEHPRTQDHRSISKACEQFITLSHRHFSCRLSCYVGRPIAITGIPDQVDSLLEMDTENVTMSNRVLVLGETPKQAPGAAVSQIDEWLELMKLLSKDELLRGIEQYCGRLKRHGCSAQELKEFQHDFLQMIYHVLQLKGLQARMVFSDSTDSIAFAVRSVDHLQEWAKYVVLKAIRSVETIEESHTVVEKAKKFIAENIDKNLSREVVAEHVCLSPDHLTRVFKKKTGKAISEYLMEERIRHAKHLLTFTDFSISEVASSVGYINFSHFSKIFRRMTNMNPLDFRKRYRTGGRPVN